MWILPSRNRPHNVARLFAQWPLVGSSTPGRLAVDADDPKLDEYCAVALPDNWQIAVFPRLSMGAKTNAVWEMNRLEPWYGYIDDDALPRTWEWDKRLVEAAGANGIAHCWNGIGNEKLASQPVLGGDLVRELGWILYPGIARVYGDDILTAIGRKRGCITYLPDVQLEAMHWSNGKAPRDEGYFYPEHDADKAIYDKWIAAGMPC